MAKHSVANAVRTGSPTAMWWARLGINSQNPIPNEVAHCRQVGFVATNSAQPMLPALAESTQKDSASTVPSMVS